jgi:hypothetical protein
MIIITAKVSGNPPSQIAASFAEQAHTLKRHSSFTAKAPRCIEMSENVVASSKLGGLSQTYLVAKHKKGSGK